MQSEEEFMAEFDRAHAQYIEARARAGFPFSKPGTKPLPSWVVRVGERPAPTFVSRSKPAEAKPAAPVEQIALVAKVEQPTPAVTKQVVGKSKSKAEMVRDMIRAAMAVGKTIDDVIAQARAELGMGNAQAKTYVTENWTRVSKG
jgi:hypothetical protein